MANITLAEFMNMPSSEKTLVATVHPGERLVGWTLHSGSIYYRDINYYLWQVLIKGVGLNYSTTLAGMTAGTFHWDESLKRVYVWTTDSVDPSSVYTFGIYKLFFSTSPVYLPHNLTTGHKIVPWEPLISESTEFGASLDSDRKGTALESTSSISFYNNDRYFDDIFDKLIWENKEVYVYAIHRKLNLADKVQLVHGYITGKSFSSDSVSFEITDFYKKLGDDISVPRYAITDFMNVTRQGWIFLGEQADYDAETGMGDYWTNIEVNSELFNANQPKSIDLTPASYDTGKYKRRVYGRVDGMIIPSANKVEDMGICLSGRFATQLDGEGHVGNVYIGTGSDVHTELSPGDEIYDWVDHVDSRQSMAVYSPSSMTVTSVSKIDINADQQMELEMYWNDPILSISGVGTEAVNWLNTQYVKAGDSICLNGYNFQEANRGTWIVSSVGDNEINVTGKTGVTQISVIINDVNNGEGIKGITCVSEVEQFITVSAPSFSILDNYEGSGIVGGVKFYVVPNSPTTARNRRFFVSHHQLHDVNTTVVSVNPGQKYITVSSNLSDLRVGDILQINSMEWQINNIETSTNRLILDYYPVEKTDATTIANLATVTPAMAVKRSCVQHLYHSPVAPDKSQYTKASYQFTFGNNYDITTPYRFVSTDYDVTNTATGCYLTLKPLAEFNRAKILKSRVQNEEVTFTQNSRIVYSKFWAFKNFKSRMWIRAEDSEPWYEVEELLDDWSIVLRTKYAGSTKTVSTHRIKSPSYVLDDSVVSCDVYGKIDSTGALISTAPGVVRDTLIESYLSARIDEASFTKANLDAEHLVSICLPLPGNDSLPNRKELINYMNETIYGSLFNNLQYNISYKVFTPQRDFSTIRKLDDGDILGFTVNVDSSKIVTDVIVSYRHKDYDYKLRLEKIDFVIRASNTEVKYSNPDFSKIVQVSIYLYDKTAAEIMANRIAFINRTSQSLVTIQTKLQTLDLCINDLIEIDFDRLYTRFGSSVPGGYKIGTINDIKKTEVGVQLTIDDLGNIFNASGMVAPGTAVNFDSASDWEKRYYTYLTDDDDYITEDIATIGVNKIF